MDNIKIDTILKAGTKVGLVFDLDGDFVKVKEAIIYDIFIEKMQIIISQTNLPYITKNYKYKTMHITALDKSDMKGEFSYGRSGLSCNIKKFIEKYKLSNNVFEKALLISYSLPLKNINMRHAYRLEPIGKFIPSGIIAFKTAQFKSLDYFKILNISLTGIGFIFFKPKGNSSNTMVKVKVGDIFVTKLYLNNDESVEYDIITIAVKVMRKKIQRNGDDMLIGTQIIKIRKADKIKLSNFIHKGQLFNIRNNKRFI